MLFYTQKYKFIVLAMQACHWFSNAKEKISYKLLNNMAENGKIINQVTTVNRKRQFIIPLITGNKPSFLLLTYDLVIKSNDIG